MQLESVIGRSCGWDHRIVFDWVCGRPSVDAWRRNAVSRDGVPLVAALRTIAAIFTTNCRNHADPHSLQNA